MAIITVSGRAALAASIKQSKLHLAWGVGEESWGTEPPPDDIEKTALVREVGRRLVDSVNFCVGDDDGEVAAPTGRFRITEEPSNNLLFTCRYDFEDGAGFTIREIGLFVNTTVKEGAPPGQRYFLPDEIEDQGILLAIENITPIIRVPSTRETFSFVITF